MGTKCSSCGSMIDKDQNYCPNCGARKEDVEEVKTEKVDDKKDSSSTTNNTPKSKIAAGVLGLCFGSLGIHNFYLGYMEKGITQLLLSTVGWLLCGLGPIVSWFWALVESIMIFTGTISTDAEGTPLSN